MFNILLDSRGWSMLRVRAGALVLFGLFGGVAALAPASPAAADAAVVDLAIQYVGTSLTNVIVGDSFGTTVVVSNVGTRTSNAFVVVVSAPSSLQISPQPAFATWSCSPIASGVTCSHEGLQPGETDVLSLPTTLVAGTPGDTLEVTARALTVGHELSTANNVGQTTVNVVAPGTIRGTVWVDVDRDGQREPEEPVVPGGADGVQRLLFIPVVSGESGSGPIVGAVSADGTYSATLRPGRYIVQMEVPADEYLSFTYPNVGDDATDSDVATAGSDPWVLAGRSDPTYVTSYGEVVIDAGLIERTQL